MTTPAASRRPVAAPRRAFACVLAVAAGGTLTAQGPAAKLGTVRPVAPVVARGGSPEAESKAPPPAALPPGYKPSVFETFEDRAKALGPMPGPQPKAGPAPVGPTQVSQSVASAPAKPKSVFDSTWKELKGYVAGKPSVPFTPAGSPPAAAAPPQDLAAPPRPVYAGPPAYRWFGWGTTVPGANPLAPNGQYPQASANWYAQTGATPGAFPVQIVQSPPPPPGIEPPKYANFSPAWDVTPQPPEPGFVPPPAGVPTNAPMPTMLPDPLFFGGYYPADAPTDLRPIAQSPSGPPAVGSIELPPPNGLVPQSVGPVQVPFSPGPEIQWQPVGARSQATPEITQTGAWTPAESATPTAIEQQVRAACKGVAEVVAVRPTGPGRLTVRLAARTESHARVAADEVTRLPALRGYDVAFEAKFGDH